MRGWGFWDWVGYTAIWVAAAVVAFDAAIKGASNGLRETIASWINLEGAKWSYSPAILITFGTAILITQHYLYSPSQQRMDSDSLPGKIVDIPRSRSHVALRLRFTGQDTPPTMIRRENVLTWYALWRPGTGIRTVDQAGKQEDHMVSPKNWTIFIIFERPTEVDQIVISIQPPGFPAYEVKWTTTISAIVTTSEDIPAGEVEISSIP